MTRRGKALIVGAGFGGLSCAIRLACQGYEVTVLEQQEQVGGKLQRITAGEYQFDRGPSTITMPQIFRNVFRQAGKNMDDYVKLYPLEPRTRNVFADGNVVDLTSNQQAMQEQIGRFSPQDALRYIDFLQESRELYRYAQERFLNKLPLSWKDKLTPDMIFGLLRVRPQLTLQKLLLRYFTHPNTLSMFGRYATYVGSSPYQAPSIFAMLAHVEADQGIFGVQGGTYELIRGFRRLAEELGVRIEPGTQVSSLRVSGGRAAGLETNRGFYEAPLVIMNGDLLSASAQLIAGRDRPSLSDRRIAAYEPSLSGFVIMAGIPVKYEQLLHHTVFFPADYQREFKDIFEYKRPPSDPAIYICNSSYSDGFGAPAGGSNLFILANAPYLSDSWDFTVEQEAYTEFLLTKLDRLGLTGIRQGDVLETYTPADLSADTHAYRGAIYGISSNSMRQAFFRPPNRSRDIQGLWFAGGTTHPGGGTPMVTLSGQLVADYIAKETR